jgi:L-threonylcarbamoyladenylate synthase
MRTDLLSALTATEREKAIAHAVKLLRKGETVALPTETVYGLAANALDPIAVAKIFEAKERPRFDPLIVHLPNRECLERVAHLTSPAREMSLTLADKFWPGPFTMVLPQRKMIPDIVTAGLDTIAVRISAHPVFHEIVRAFGKPLAAPSANRFGQVSPTTAQHVFDELEGRIPLIIDAGQTEHGLESTIVTVQDGRIQILRRGPITAEQLSEFANVDTVAPTKTISSPGQLPSHYAPKTPLELIDTAGNYPLKRHERVGLLAWRPVESFQRFAAVRQLSQEQDPREAAANLFRYLRELDALGLDCIIAERVPSQGLGAAIMDRLERASHR